MTENQYCRSSVDEYETLNWTINKGCDLNEYEAYVDKIRRLFAPSLEDRIYSCLETFVYSKDRETLTEQPPYSKRCPNVAATRREPVDAFSTELQDCGYLEKIMAQAVKYLFKDGPIDCFLNSIILNNRLAKICRNLDAIGVEKDFLRYLAVWNYMKEKDYWMEEDKKISTSVSDTSDDSIESHSDLDVQVGSGLDTRRAKGYSKKSLKRGVFSKYVNNFAENRDKGNVSGLKYESRLGTDSRNPEFCKSSGTRRKRRSNDRTYPRGPSNCPTYGTKNVHRGKWEGKSLKMRILKNCPSTVDDGPANPLRLLKLPLPCKFDDVIAEIVKADRSIPGSFSVATRKKLRAGVKNNCRCVNEKLGKMCREEVGRCRFRCEIMPGFVAFKLIRRESNGCKVSLFTDKVTTDKIDGRYAPRLSLVKGKTLEKVEKMEENISHESQIQIGENIRGDSADDDSRIVASSLRLFQSKLDAVDENKSAEFVVKESSKNLSDNDINEEENRGACRAERDKTTKDVNNNSMESLAKAILEHSIVKVIEDETRDCNNSHDNKLEILNRESEKIRDANRDDSFQAKRMRYLGEEFIPENSLRENKLEDRTRLRGNLFPEAFDVNRDSEINEESDRNEHFDKNLEDFVPSDPRESSSSAFISNSHERSSTVNEKADSVLLNRVKNDQRVSMPRMKSSGSRSEGKYRNEIEKYEIRCECPSDSRARINKCNDEYKPEDRDSQCCCDSCGAPDKPMTGNRVLGAARISPSVNRVPSGMDSPIPNNVKPILIDENENVGGVGKVELQPNRVESRATLGWESHYPKSHRDASIKSKISFESNEIVTNLRFFDTEINETDETRDSLKSLGIGRKKPTNSEIKESNKKSSMAKSPIRIERGGRVSSSKSQRINISIELCTESESSEDKSLENEGETISPLRQNNLTRSRGVQDIRLTRKPRYRRSPDAQTSGKKRAISPSKRNSKDECFEHRRHGNACPHSPTMPRALESRDYRSPCAEPSSGMSDPIECGTSAKSNVRSVCKFERRSMRQREIRKNDESKYAKSNGTERCSNEIPENLRIYEADESPKQFPRATRKPERISSSPINNNLCHAFSASSLDRMKHLIKTKLRRILLERDKATNTPKTSLTNEKYRVSVPNGKTKGLPFTRQRCRTIWESQSASDSTRRSKTFGSNGPTSLAGISQRDEIKSIFNSTRNPNISSSKRKDLEKFINFRSDDNAKRYCLRNSDRSVVSSRVTIDPRLVGGSDAPHQKRIHQEFQYSWKREARESVDPTCTGNSEVTGKKLAEDQNQDEIIKCRGKLDWSDNSTSRHIYLWKYENFDSTDEKDEKKYCSSEKNSSEKFHSLPICEKIQVQKNSWKKREKAREHFLKEYNYCFYERRYNGESNIPRNIRTPSFFSSKMDTTRNVRCQKGFGKLDQDLRSKLLRYASLCKNVKYSLLKMLRPEDINEVSGTSIP